MDVFFDLEQVRERLLSISELTIHETMDDHRSMGLLWFGLIVNRIRSLGIAPLPLGICSG